MTTNPSAIQLRGRLDPELNRGMWLVKWLLLIPHLVVLTFLWLAFTVLTMVAFFAILLTGRYPKSIFEFNVGVLRWTWRVWFYGYGALATDRYPPFSLGPEPDYPATLDIAYPGQLSRGLVLVKWWLLALPHYVVVGFFVGSGFVLWRFGGGLVSVLAIIAGSGTAVRRALPARDLRLHHGHEPLGVPRRRLRRADDRRVPTVPNGHRWRRTHHAGWAGSAGRGQHPSGWTTGRIAGVIGALLFPLGRPRKLSR